MKIKSQQYALALFDLVKEKKGKELEKALASFANILVKRNDVFKLEKILAEFENSWYQENLVIKAEVKSARALSGKTLKDLAEKLKSLTKAKELLFEEKIDKSIMGGAVIKYGDKILDAGLKNRLDKLKESLAL